MRSLALFLIFLYAPFANAQEVSTWKDNVRGWYVGIDHTVADSCFVHSIFESGTSLRLQWGWEFKGVVFMIGNAKWQSIEENKKYEIEIAFGNQPAWSGAATGKILGGEVKYVSIDILGDNGLDFLLEFMEQSNVRVSFNGNQISNLSLRGTFAAGQELLSCQEAANEQNDDPFANANSSNDDPFDL